MATKPLLSQIADDVVSDSPLADTLRKCMLLGGKAGSIALRDWASKELRGYEIGEPDVPGYRTVQSLIYADAVIGSVHMKEQPVGLDQLPDFTHGKIDESFTFYEGVGALEAYERQAEDGGGVLRLAIPSSTDLGLYMDSRDQQYGRKILRLYWKVPVSALHAMTDRVRTTLAELVAEMQAGTAAGEPSGEVADQAVNVAVHGSRNRVIVVSARAGGGGDAHADARIGENETAGWSRTRKIGAAVTGLAGIVVCAVTVIEFVH